MRHFGRDGLVLEMAEQVRLSEACYTSSTPTTNENGTIRVSRDGWHE